MTCNYACPFCSITGYLLRTFGIPNIEIIFAKTKSHLIVAHPKVEFVTCLMSSKLIANMDNTYSHIYLLYISQ